MRKTSIFATAEKSTNEMKKIYEIPVTILIETESTTIHAIMESGPRAASQEDLPTVETEESSNSYNAMDGFLQESSNNLFED